ncbi:FAD-dependent pyridine nucleotide-disulfide oxidoreductase [Sterolibacterium denitrificans]|uniref:FAD-dependent pyridine nucleotide-disulfide oxidoreductase n=2 Tax=Sterolibacterium denitrificans TaxID=157592 RepID=A0A7Z7HS31_9PROT|nr:FAD-dependent pyridine nucleotide-disulfide oxidoreductase [Sterolibacterium denitrificans]
MVVSPARNLAAMTHILILGAGFAAVTAARELRRLQPQARITLVAPKPEFVYLPSLIWIPTHLRQGGGLIRPLQPFLQRHRLEFHQAQVSGLADGGRTVLTDRGELKNDALLIATGGRFIRKLPGIEHALTLCEGIAAAEAIRDRLTAMRSGRIAFGFGGNPQEPAAMRGGPMFELLFGVETMLRQQQRREAFTLTFFNPATEPGKRLGDKAVGKILAAMARRRIATHLGHKLVSFSAQGVTTEGGQIDADLILFMPGLTGPQWAENSGLPLSPGGFIQADAYCRVPTAERVFIAGDAGSFPGPDWLPKQAHMAELQARAAAQNLHLALQGHAPTAQPRPELMCIIDTLDSGIMVYRSPQRSMVFPANRLFHWSKKAFEKRYLASLNK